MTKSELMDVLAAFPEEAAAKIEDNDGQSVVDVKACAQILFLWIRQIVPDDCPDVLASLRELTPPN